MSYDIYCYRSKSGIPTDDENDSFIAEDIDKWSKVEKHPATKLAIVKALTAYNPQLEAVDFQYGPVAALTVDIIEKETRKFHHITINHPEDDLSLRLIVYDNHVYLTVPYHYKGEEAVRLFGYIRAYVRIIRETAGYFVFDQQTGKAFDPAQHEFDGLRKYLSVQGIVEERFSPPSIEQPKKKSWWKFW